VWFFVNLTILLQWLGPMSVGRLQPTYVSDDCEIDLAKRELRVGGASLPIGARAFQIAEILVQSAGRLVTKDELMDRIWPGAIVMENTLQVHAAAVRKALGRYRGLLKTESRRGYRLLGAWSVRQHGMVMLPTGPREVRVSEDLPITNIPGSLADLVGREAAVGHVRSLVSAYRTVTLAGPGGVGKTSLALEVARGLLDDFADGGCLVELGSLSDPSLVPIAVARALELQLGGDAVSAEAVARTIGWRHLLLVMDNCEHVIDAAADLAETAVRLCPRVTLLTTSREVLRIEGEYVYRVVPLEVPTPGMMDVDKILSHSAVKLFITRMQALDTDFMPSEDALGAIAGICRQLDGIPLAIEFAAARAAALGIEQVAASLCDRFALLTNGRRTAAPRHRTLRATLDWSYNLLSEAEQRLLRHLAVFPAGCTLHAAAFIVDDLPGAESRVAADISNLVLKSLVILDRSAVASRWSMLETIRSYALEKLASQDEIDGAARRQAEFFRDIYATSALTARWHVQGDDMRSYSCELNNVRAALDWCFSPEGDREVGVALTAAYVPAWLHAALPAECRERTDRAVSCLTSDMSISSQLRMQLYFAYGLMPAYTMSPVEPAKEALAEALALAEQLADVQAQFQILWGLWVLNATGGGCRVALSVTEHLARVARQIGEPAATLMVQRLRGFALQQMGQHAEARQCFEHIVDHYVPPSDPRLTAWGQFDQRVLARAMLARALWLQGFPEQAMMQARLSLTEAQQTDYALSIGEALRVALCDIELMTGDLTGAEQSVTLLTDIAASRNAPFWGISGRCLWGKLQVMRGDFEQGCATLQAELDLCERVGWAVWYPEFAAALAEGLIELGRLQDALVVVEKGMASANQGGERIYYPELLRLQGVLQLNSAAAANEARAEEYFCEAIVMAQQQGALALELRAALSLAGLRAARGRMAEARIGLAIVYAKFTEGFGTTDLRAARTMLDTLLV
jgi:predicted ATPase/DNA-binding winged helix-turn-helix (wHTH) protein